MVSVINKHHAMKIFLLANEQIGCFFTAEYILLTQLHNYIPYMRVYKPHLDF
jgi:hypothetical protein